LFFHPLLIPWHASLPNGDEAYSALTIYFYTNASESGLSIFGKILNMNIFRRTRSENCLGVALETRLGQKRARLLWQ
jgi:hypothetical protein